MDPKNQHAAIATNSGADIPKTITIDPASPTGADEEAMQVDETEEQTPGHLAWGAFEIPDVQLEITVLVASVVSYFSCAQSAAPN